MDAQRTLNAFVRHRDVVGDGGDEDGQFSGNCAILDEIPSLVPSRVPRARAWKLESSVKSRYQKNRGKEGH